MKHGKEFHDSSLDIKLRGIVDDDKGILLRYEEEGNAG